MAKNRAVLVSFWVSTKKTESKTDEMTGMVGCRWIYEVQARIKLKLEFMVSNRADEI